MLLEGSISSLSSLGGREMRNKRIDIRCWKRRYKFGAWLFYLMVLE